MRGETFSSGLPEIKPVDGGNQERPDNSLLEISEPAPTTVSPEVAQEPIANPFEAAATAEIAPTPAESTPKDEPTEKIMEPLSDSDDVVRLQEFLGEMMLDSEK